MHDFHKITIGSRKSPLAKSQVKILIQRLVEAYGIKTREKIDLKFFTTSGDRFLNKKISEIGNKGLFTKEIDDAQLNSKLDIGVHSLKDLPNSLPDGLIVAGVLKRESPNDVIYSRERKNLINFKPQSIIGTSSIRRKVQISKIRPDLILKDIRGNVETRIEKLKKGTFDAIVLAHAGLKRLNINKGFTLLKLEEIVPAVGQGTIALVIKKNNNKIKKIVEKLSHSKSFLESKCERIFLNALDGSCRTPIGGYAKIIKENDKEKILFKFMVSSLDGKKFFKDDVKINLKDSDNKIFKLGLELKKKI